MATWQIQYQPHGLMVTCQRPIVISTKVTDGAVAHFRGSLYILDGVSWTDTKIEINAYNDDDTGFPAGTYFSCNVAEYCKNFFLESEGFYNLNTGWCSNFRNMAHREFKLRMYPVEYDLSGNLVPDPSDYTDSDSFIVIPTNTEARESTSSIEDNIRIDKWVLNGNNNSAAPMGSSYYNRLLTNMPNHNVVNVSAGNSYYNYLQRQVAGRTTRFHFWNSSGTEYTLDGDITTGYGAFPLLPIMIDFLLSLQSGVTVNAFTDVGGNLSSTTMKLQMKFIDSTTLAFIRSSPAAHYKLQEDFTCEETDTFTFRNMRGGFDFFTATGTKNRGVELSGSEFDRHTTFSRSYADFDLKRGQHNTTNLWNSKKEIYSIFTQPLTKEYAIWLEELIMSPQVWVVKDIKDFQNSDGVVDGKGLVAINILKGSYKTFSTEKNVHFIEFKYTLSENTITQKM